MWNYSDYFSFVSWKSLSLIVLSVCLPCNFPHFWEYNYLLYMRFHLQIKNWDEFGFVVVAFFTCEDDTISTSTYIVTQNALFVVTKPLETYHHYADYNVWHLNVLYVCKYSWINARIQSRGLFNRKTFSFISSLVEWLRLSSVGTSLPKWCTNQCPV